MAAALIVRILVQKDQVSVSAKRKKRKLTLYSFRKIHRARFILSYVKKRTIHFKLSEYLLICLFP